MIRPKPIVVFEMIFCAVLVLGVIKIWWNWGDFLENNIPIGIGLTVLIVRLLIIGGLVFLISRKRKKLAVWVLILITLGPIVSNVFLIFRVSASTPTIDHLLMVLLESGVEIFAIALLFTRPSKAWFSNKDNTTKLTQTFS